MSSMLHELRYATFCYCIFSSIVLHNVTYCNWIISYNTAVFKICRSQKNKIRFSAQCTGLASRSFSSNPAWFWPPVWGVESLFDCFSSGMSNSSIKVWFKTGFSSLVWATPKTTLPEVPKPLEQHPSNSRRPQLSTAQTFSQNQPVLEENGQG